MTPATEEEESAATTLFRWSDRFLTIFLIVAGLVALGLGLFPAFYYMEWIVVGSLSFAVILPVLVGNIVVRLIERFQHRSATTQRNRQLAGAFLFFALVWTSLFFQLPMRLGFLTIRPKLEYVMAGLTPREFSGLKSDLTSPLYPISAATTNLRWDRGTKSSNCNTNRVLFFFARDGESAFIYSPSGIQDLCYNSGSAGHLIGPWYWMKED